MKKIPLEQLLKESRAETYAEQYRYVRRLIEAKKIKAVKASPLNGKTPALPVSYWLAEDVPDERKRQEKEEDLKFHMSPAIRTDYYLNHLEVYGAEEHWVTQLNRYFLEQGEGEPEPVSLNERSFQIWGREKFLQKEQGKKVLAHCGVSLEQLRVYATSEPLAYYSASRQAPQTVLIIENKDTFYSMRRHLMAGGRRMFGEEIGTVIYGAGKGIWRSYEDFRFCVEPHMNDGRNRILYFGDLDYEGIGIYERLAALFGEGEEPYEVEPFAPAYRKMLEKAEHMGMDFLPETSENQNRCLSGRFFGYFPEDMKERMERILLAGRYIPQEIIHVADLP